MKPRVSASKVGVEKYGSVFLTDIAASPKIPLKGMNLVLWGYFEMGFSSDVVAI